MRERRPTEALDCIMPEMKKLYAIQGIFPCRVRRLLSSPGLMRGPRNVAQGLLADMERSLGYLRKSRFRDEGGRPEVSDNAVFAHHNSSTSEPLSCKRSFAGWKGMATIPYDGPFAEYEGSGHRQGEPT